MPANTPRGLPYPLPTEPVAEGAQAIRNLAEAIKGWQCIDEKDPSGNITAFSAIPQTFDHLRLLVLCRSVKAIKADELSMRFNNASATQYFTSNQVINNGVASINQFLSQAYGRIGYLPGTVASAGFFGLTDIVIPLYTTTAVKHWTGTSYCHAPQASTSADLYTTIIGGSWNGAAAVTSIQLFTGATGELLAAGSRAWLYGISGV